MPGRSLYLLSTTGLAALGGHYHSRSGTEFSASMRVTCLLGAQTKHIGMKCIGMKPIATKPIDIKGIGYKTGYRYRYIKHIAGLNISLTKPIGTKPIAI